MAKGYRPVRRDEVFLLPPSMREWLSADHPVWLVIRAVQVMDTGPFHDRRRTGGAGTAGYDPDMLVTVLAWAYAHQVTSSRRIEELCRTDVAFRVICGGNLPDHTTIARFRADFAGPVAAFFAEVLGLCAQLGMGKLGVVALDGTKIAASASKSANRTEGTLRKLARETVARHGRDDAAEDGMLGEGRRGDEVPGDAWSPRSRDARIAAALASLRAGREAAEAERDERAGAYLEKARAGRPPAGKRPAGTGAGAARIAVEQATAAQQAKIEDWERRDAQNRAAGGGGLRNPPRRPASAHVRVRAKNAALERAIQRAARDERRAAEKHDRRKGPGPVRNITDPDSRLMPVRGGGFIQGYNAQLVTSEDGLIIAAALTPDTGDAAWLRPMMAAAGTAAAIITARQPASSPGGDSRTRPPAGYQPPRGDGQPGYTGPIGLFLADAGYCSEDNITAPGPPRLIATGKRRDLERAARDSDPGQQSSRQHTAAMAALLQTEDAITAYRRRGHIAETPNGDLKHNKGFRQLSVRGLARTSGELTFTTATLNLFKAISTGHLTHTALDHLTTPPGTPASPA